MSVHLRIAASQSWPLAGGDGRWFRTPADGGGQDNALVLIVEVDPLFRAAMTFECHAIGCRTITAGNEARVLDVITRARPSLIIVDEAMPPMRDGALLRRIRGFPAGRSIPILVVSSRGDDADERLALASGATAYIRKPFPERDLVARITSLIGP